MVRCRPALADAALEDLAWLGLRWEQPVLRQSAHFPAYRAAADRLSAMGLLYPCFATRAEIAKAAAANPGARDPDGAPLYPGLFRGYPAADAHRRMAAGEPYALRLDMAQAMSVAAGIPLTFLEMASNRSRTETIVARPERWGDAVIVRKDVPASYHLAVVVDDARQGVTHVTRGRDLYAATDLHRLLQVLLGLPEPVYHHHRLITDAYGRKLSKSARDTSIRSLRESGWTPDDMRQAILQQSD